MTEDQLQALNIIGLIWLFFASATQSGLAIARGRRAKEVARSADGLVVSVEPGWFDKVELLVHGFLIVGAGLCGAAAVVLFLR